MVYDVVIIGGGPAGLTAGIYVKRAMLNAVLFERMGIGGQIIITDLIENFPGFLEISGAALAAKFEEQAHKFSHNIFRDNPKKAGSKIGDGIKRLVGFIFRHM